MVRNSSILAIDSFVRRSPLRFNFSSVLLFSTALRKTAAPLSVKGFLETFKLVMPAFGRVNNVVIHVKYVPLTV